MKQKTAQSLAGPVVGLAVVGASLFGLGSLASSALFTDRESVLDNEFVTGRVDLSASDAWAVFEAPSMLPGDVVVSPLEMSNEGTAELRYALTSSLTPPADSAAAPEAAAGEETLAGVGFDASPQELLEEGAKLATQIDLTVAVADSPSACRAENFENLTEVVYGPDDLSGISDVALFGDSQAGFQGGERVLAPGRSETLCMKVELPIDTDNEYQELAATAYLTAWAEQTRNND